MLKRYASLILELSSTLGVKLHFVPMSTNSGGDPAVFFFESGIGRGRFCEWGSGFGIATGLAEMLGFDAMGIEIDPQVAEASRQLLSDFGLTARIETGDYLSRSDAADVYFVYCWPGKVVGTDAHFERVAPPNAKLLICYGQSDIRLKSRDA